MTNRLDSELRARFHERARDLNDEAFIVHTMKRIQSERSRMKLRRRLLQAVGLVVVALLSPFLIEGSLVVSNGLDSLFTWTGTQLVTPLGALIAAGCLAPLFVANRRRRLAGMRGLFPIELG